MKESVFVLLLFSSLCARQFTDQYSQETGGMGSAVWNSTTDQDGATYDVTHIDLRPFYHVFLLKNAYIGPAIRYAYIQEKATDYSSSENTWGLGFDAGLVLRTSSVFIPFVQANYTYDILKVHGENPYPDNIFVYDENEGVHRIGFDVGVKIQFAPHVSINLSSGFSRSFAATTGVLTDNSGTLDHSETKTEDNEIRILSIGISALLF